MNFWSIMLSLLLCTHAYIIDIKFIHECFLGLFSLGLFIAVVIGFVYKRLKQQQRSKQGQSRGAGERCLKVITF